MINRIASFFQSVSRPLIVVGTLPVKERIAAAAFLERLNAPVYLEGISGIREEPRLQHLRLTYTRNIWELPIDGIFRLGGVPTARFWRDLEGKQGKLSLLSYSHLPWTGASWGEVIQGGYSQLKEIGFCYGTPWYQEPACFREARDELFEAFPQSEPAMIRKVSMAIPNQSLVYLGNSQPIREWDLAAADKGKKWDVFASRGANGIDGQLSTFLGMTQPGLSNWCLLGDLTALYDLAAPWVIAQLEQRKISIVVINNGGGMIFSRMSERQCLQNRHGIGFEYFAKMWGLNYLREEGLEMADHGARLIEIVPCQAQTKSFWKAYACLGNAVQVSDSQFVGQ